MIALALRVRQVEPLSASLKRVTLESADGGLLPASLPGAHLSMVLPAPARALRNSYSVTSHHDQRAHYELIVRRTAASRGGSAFIHEALKAGDVVEAAVPNSQFPIQNLARKHLLIGGGIGITPLLSFLPALRDRGERCELHQFAQPGEVEIFERLLEPHSDHRIHVHAGRGGAALRDILAAQPLGTHLYCCGPSALMDAVQQTAALLGWPRNRVHLESFGSAGGQPFMVRLARSGGTVAVGEHQTMLEALEQADLPVPSLCRGGACGQCLARVIEGVPDHRDHYLSDAEKAAGDCVMPCVSRARSASLTLDL